MKKLFPIAIVCLFAFSTQAQNTPTGTDSKSSPAKETTTKESPAKAAPAPAGETAPAPIPVEQAGQSVPKASQDGVMMVNGKMWETRGGQTAIMLKEVTMTNGTKVMPDGSYITKEGTKMTFQNGDSMGKDGKVVKAKNDKKASEPKAPAPNPQAPKGAPSK